MPRAAKTSGQNKIDNAQVLFEQSVRRGQPDFHFVALAIGASPLRPPRWAMLACIVAKEEVEGVPAAGSASKEVGAILDEVVRFCARWQQARPRDPPGSEHTPPPLREAIVASCRVLGLRKKHLDAPANDDWMRDVRRAWDWEQANDSREGYLVLDGWRTTGRIERVLTALYGIELGMPADPMKALWLHEAEKS